MTRAEYVDRLIRNYDEEIFNLCPWLLQSFDGAEIWKDISGEEGRYQISTMGRVKSLPKFRVLETGKGGSFYTKEKMLKTVVTRGYEIVSRKDIYGKPYARSVHRLVAKMFLPNPLNLPEVNHIDAIKLHNYVHNLEWITKAGNKQHAIEMGLCPTRYGEQCRSKLTNEQAIEIFNSKENVHILSEKFKVTKWTIYDIRRGRNWKHITIPDKI